MAFSRVDCTRPRERSRNCHGAAERRRTATAEQAFPRGRLAETVTPERYSLTLEIDPAQPEFSGEVEIALRINQATQRIRCASGTVAEAFPSMPQSASRPRTGRGWKARAKDNPVWRRPAR
jgi:hypothetical protein